MISVSNSLENHFTDLILGSYTSCTRNIGEIAMRLLVDSSMIVACEYKASENKLIVEFRSGKIYVYQNVPNILFLELMETESFGKWFHANILKNPEKYPYTQLPVNLIQPTKTRK